MIIADRLIDLNISRLQNSCRDGYEKNYFYKQIGIFSGEWFPKKLRKCKFSVIVGESTDCSETKSLAIMVKYYDQEYVIRTAMLGLADVYSDVYLTLSYSFAIE